MLLFNYGSPKEARYELLLFCCDCGSFSIRFIPNCLHMGYPTANSYVFPWLERVMA